MRNQRLSRTQSTFGLQSARRPAPSDVALSEIIVTKDLDNPDPGSPGYMEAGTPGSDPGSPGYMEAGMPGSDPGSQYHSNIMLEEITIVSEY